MGVLEFFSIVINGKAIKDYGKEVTLEKLAKESTFRVCVDASNMIYGAILAFSLQQGDSLTSKEGKFTMHINTIFNKILQLEKLGLEQVWIFDSPQPNPLKEKELKRRQEVKDKAVDLRAKFKITSDHIKEIQLLLTLMGITWIEAPKGVEAEQYGAWMTQGDKKDRYCRYMISGDSDVVLFGGNLLRPLKKRSSTGKSAKTVYQLFEYEDLLREGNITREQLLKIGVTMGTDFNDHIMGVGVKTVEKKVKNGDVDKKFTEAHKASMEYFQSDISDQIGESDLHTDKFNQAKLLKFLEERSFNVEIIKTKLKEYKKK
jgi:flap endonuclease-1